MSTTLTPDALRYGNKLTDDLAAAELAVDEAKDRVAEATTIRKSAERILSDIRDKAQGFLERHGLDTFRGRSKTLTLRKEERVIENVDTDKATDYGLISHRLRVDYTATSLAEAEQLIAGLEALGLGPYVKWEPTVTKTDEEEILRRHLEGILPEDVAVIGTRRVLQVRG